MKIAKYNKKIVLFLILLIIMPVDWFSPTGILLREAGAKPAIPLLLLIFFILLCYFILIKRKWMITPQAKSVVLILTLILILGTWSYLYQLLINGGGLENSHNRIRLSQFINQSLMQVAFICIFIAFISINNTIKYNVIILALRTSLIFHLAFYFLEEFRVLPYMDTFAHLFRGQSTLIDRSSGLMSEPSYFGVFSALYAMPLIFRLKPKPIDYVLCLLAFGCTIYSSSKSFFPVILLQLVILFIITIKFKYFRIKLLILSLAITPITFIVLSKTNVFQVYENLSSMNRFGSTLTALNIIIDGNIISGIGTGQFHFNYTQEYAPSFLSSSDEALMQMEGLSSSRASTYNLPIRYLVEAGVFSFIFYMLIFHLSLKNSLKYITDKKIIGILFTFGSLGFLTTQDPYCYPPLAFGLSLIFSSTPKGNYESS